MRKTSQSVSISNDSIFQLLVVPSKEDSDDEDDQKSLDIVPLKYCNIARFFNAINNSVKGSKQKRQNTVTCRRQIDGQVHVFLHTTKKIKAGEILQIDYNEGQLSKGEDNLYDTSGFL